MPETFHTAWVDVDLEAVQHNYREIKRHVGPGVAVMAVIKTNAYGHGLDLVAGALSGEADWFGVSTVEEGIRARAAAPGTPILVFHPVNAWNAAEIVAHDLTATVDSEAGAEALSAAGLAAGNAPQAHLKVDTGMSRFGMLESPFEWGPHDERRIRWTGAYTHLATAGDRNTRPAKQQLARFKSFREANAGKVPAGFLFHALNSAGLLRFKDDRLNMVRSGTLLFGQYPSSYVPRRLGLKPTFAYRTRIISVREIPAGATVGYGAEWKAPRPSRIATIPVGYFDGFTVEPTSVWKRQSGFIRGLVRRLRGQDAVTVKTSHGKAHIVGRIAAQSAMLDVTDLPAVTIGDIVEIPARRVLVGEHVPRIPVAPDGGVPSL